VRLREAVEDTNELGKLVREVNVLFAVATDDEIPALLQTQS
jgi:hypothetical protein